MDYIGYIIAFVIGLLLSKIDPISIREAKILTILGWLIALYFGKGGI